MLLRAEYRAWAGNTDPSNEEGGRELVVLHGVASDQGTCTSQTSFAVDSQDTWVALAHLQKFVHDEIGRGRTVNKEHISVVDAILRELSPVVFRLIQANHMRNAEVFKHLQVVLGLITSSVVTDLINGTHECDELFG